MKNPQLYTSKSGEWRTPINLYKSLDEEHHFTVDAAATPENALNHFYFTTGTLQCGIYIVSRSCLDHPWTGETVYMNPPYGRQIYKFMHKAYKEAALNGVKIVALIPSRTDTAWFHDYVLTPMLAGYPVEISFYRGRLKFSGHTTGAPFPSALVIYNP